MRWLALTLLCFLFFKTQSWGFHAHKEINYLACFTLPHEMFGFYKDHISLLKAWAVKADQRRYAVESEAPKHYLDVDHFEQQAPLDTIPRKWNDAVEKYGEQQLLENGIVPWNTIKITHFLTKAFKEKDYVQIIKLSADLGHYIADAHVPLHTTKNYNGQLTNQIGIHGLWESRLPELFASDYDFFTGKAEYIEYPLDAIWNAIEASFSAKDSVLQIEKEISKLFGEKKYSFETRGSTTVKVYSKEFSLAYHNALNNMVERRMKAAIHTVGSFWYTAWVNAGEPILEFDLKKRADLQSQIDSLDVLMHNGSIKGRMETH